MSTSFPIKPITIVADVDLVIVPGDTCEGVLRAFEHLRRIVPMHIPDRDGDGQSRILPALRPRRTGAGSFAGPTFNIHVIENDTVTLERRRHPRRPLRRRHALDRLPGLRRGQPGSGDERLRQGHERPSPDRLAEEAVAAVQAAGSGAAASPVEGLHYRDARDAVCRTDRGGHPHRSALELDPSRSSAAIP